MLSKTQKLTYSAMLLAICLISMVFKGGGALMIVFLTGAIVNACIIIDTYLCGIVYGIILSIITPVAAKFISPSPVQTAVPVVIPCIMIGNAILAICIAAMGKRSGSKMFLPVSMITGSIAKALFMGIVIALIILPSMLPAELIGKLSSFQFTFSFIQLFSALVGSLYAYSILKLVNFFQRTS